MAMRLPLWQKAWPSAVGRLFGLDKGTLCSWLLRLSAHCENVLSYFFRNLHLSECQLDELWAFVYKKEDHLASIEQLLGGYSAAWVWSACSPIFKLGPAWLAGKPWLLLASRIIL